MTARRPGEIRNKDEGGQMKTEDRANEYLPLRDVVFNTLRESILTEK